MDKELKEWKYKYRATDPNCTLYGVTSSTIYATGPDHAHDKLKAQGFVDIELWKEDPDNQTIS